MLLLAFEIHPMSFKNGFDRTRHSQQQQKGKNISPLLCLFNTLDHPEFKKEKNK